MSLAETIKAIGGQAAIKHLAQRFGLDEATTAKAVALLLPAITAGMTRNATQPSGAALLFEALRGGDHARYLSDPSLLLAAATTQDGNGILGHVLGGKDASRAVAATVAGALGIENETAKQMLPMVAALAMAGVAKQMQGEGDAAAAKPESPTDLVGQLGGLLNVANASSILGSLFG
jgi:hypothetical protein